MEHRIIKTLLIGLVAVLAACYYDVEEELYPPTTCQSENMSYQNNIVPILERNCYVCHSKVAGPSNGNVIIEGYPELITYVDSGQLMGAINHQPGFSAMPKDASMLLDCDIAKIESWITAGAPNN